MRFNLKSLLTVILLFGFVFPVVTAPAILAQQEAPEVQQAPRPLQSNVKLEEIIARLERNVPQWMKEGDVPGLSIALVRDGEVAWRHAFGVKNAQTREPAADSTVFEAASLSKPVFAYAVMKLVDSGKFDLDKPLNQ